MLPASVLDWLHEAVIPPVDPAGIHAVASGLGDKVLWSGRAFQEGSVLSLVQSGGILVAIGAIAAMASGVVTIQGRRNPLGLCGRAKALRLDLALLVVAVGSLVGGWGNFVSARYDAALGYVLTEDQVVVMSGDEKAGVIPLKALKEADLSPGGLVTIKLRHGRSLQIEEQAGGDPLLRSAVQRVVSLGNEQRGRLTGPGIEPNLPRFNVFLFGIGLIISVGLIMMSMTTLSRKRTILCLGCSLYPAMILPARAWELGTMMTGAAAVSVLLTVLVLAFTTQPVAKVAEA